MQYIKHGGIDIPALGFGTYELTGTRCIEMVKAALDIGYRHIDTAQIYHNEDEIGIALMTSNVPRDEVFLTTKVWMENLAYDDVITATEQSLKKLKTDYVDLLLIHWPNASIPLEETLKAFATLKEQHKTRLIGVSNFPVRLLQQSIDILGSDIACNQVEYHPFLAQKSLLNHMKQHDIFLTAYCPLARGEINDNELIGQIAEKYGKSPSQITLRWLIQQDNVCAIPKTAHQSYALSNFDIFDFELDDDDMASIHNLACNRRLINPDWAPQWDCS